MSNLLSKIDPTIILGVVITLAVIATFAPIIIAGMAEKAKAEEAAARVAEEKKKNEKPSEKSETKDSIKAVLEASRKK